MIKLLMIGMSLNVGGTEKSLVNLLNMIDYSVYDIDLLLFQKKGAFLKQLPPEVNIIEDQTIKILFQSVKETMATEGVRRDNIKLIGIRYLATLINKIKWRQFDQIRLHRWIECYKKVIPSLDSHYDVAVAYAGGDTAYYMFDKVNADRKVYYFHSDYSRINIDSVLERQYVNLADLIITVSDECRHSLEKLFPEKKSDILVLNNLSSSNFIKKLSKEFFPDEYRGVSGGLKIVSVGRLIDIKGFDMAVDAAKILKDQGIRFRWIIVGEGTNRPNLETKIRKYSLENHFILVGMKENPYPYIACADLLIQTSRFEGKSVVLDEAKILQIPAIITNYNSANDQIRNNIDGLVVDMNAQSIAYGVCKCIKDEKLIEKLKNGICVDENVQNVSRYMECLTKS